ncbi:EAL domain-containing protein [Crenobacter sp. SG2303]|uniref:EAL domain-containing protein n=1 Tax=Crenobacter oryzisoli TaxID=3056844 RepID=A0ABT7XTF6_9NEIS|nr:EAL domain-containing protein [Crenobacter sp. SG2303]MDN0077082.1 EAL domain-containing protein [Crenobacter sp. SG2303]
MTSPQSNTNRRLLGMVWPFVLVVVLQVVLGVGSLNVLSAVRAYVGGESLWSKGQKDAIYYLSLYAESHDEADYQRYLAARVVPLGDRQARLALDQSPPDLGTASQGFLLGGNHPADIHGLIWLYRYFRSTSYIESAVQAWNEGDRYMGLLADVAEALHDGITTASLTAEQLGALRQRIQVINEGVTPVAQAFTDTLGEASRKIRDLLLWSNLGAAALLIAMAVWRTRKLIRQSAAFERALQLSEERFQLAVSGSNDGIWDWDIENGVMYYSPRYKELLGFSPDELTGDITLLADYLHPDDYASTIAAFNAHFSGHPGYDVEYRMRTKSGSYRWFRARGQAQRDASGRPIRMAGSFTDITDRKLAEAALSAEKKRAQVTLASIGDAVITTDTSGRIEYLNPAAEGLIGVKADAAHGRPLGDLFHLLDESSRQQEMHPLARILGTETGEKTISNLLLIRQDGSEVAVDMIGAPIRDSIEGIIGVVLVFHDMTRERQYIASLSWQASHDALTGLVNRREFEHRLKQLSDSPRQLCGEHSLMYLDLDQFKVVNDTCGHAAGDELLRQVCMLLQQRLRKNDTLARLGGDEFGVLLENCPPETAIGIAETLRNTVSDLHFAWNGRPFSVSVSIGVVHIQSRPTSLEEVLRAADVACYMAKEKGRNRVQVYQTDDSELSLRYGEMEWVNRIQYALEENRFCLYAQDIATLNSGKPESAHFELLIRLRDERGELVPPIAFIPAAERYGLMPLIDRWVVKMAFATLADLLDDEEPCPIATCAINLSGASIGDEQFLGFLYQQFKLNSIPPSLICFEVTETSAIANLSSASRFMNELRALGCRFSLDDFGAGMSSFAYLKHLPVDYLKIDGSFVKDMLDDPIDRAMVEAIHQIGHVMGKSTIAEFVESAAVIEMLADIGVDYAQGYAIGRPQPFSSDFLLRRRPAAGHAIAHQMPKGKDVIF